MSNKKIVFLGPVPPPYMGPSLATEIILSSKLKEEFDLIHLDTSDHRPLDTLGAIDFWNIWLALWSYVVLVAYLLRYWPKVVYIPISQTTLGYFRDIPHILISKIFGRKVVCHLRGGNFRNWYDGAKPLTRWIVRRVHRRIDGQIVLGHCLKNMFEGIIPSERIYVCPNGKDVNVADKPSPDGTIRILFLANMARTKGVLDAVEGFCLASKTEKNIELLLAGAWKEKDVKTEFEDLLKREPGLPIRNLGVVSGDAKAQLLAQADVFLFPTYYPPEGHPWVLVEAMANSLPVISTCHAAIPETIVDQENGFLIEKKSPAAIAEKIVLLSRDGDLRQRMSRRSRELYLERFTESRMVESMAKVFNSIIRK